MRCGISGLRWPRHSAELETTGQDVIVDAGRLGLHGSPEPLLDAADLALLVSRTTLPHLSALRSWAEAFQRPALDWHQSAVLLIGEGQPYNARDVTAAVNLPVLASLRRRSGVGCGLLARSPAAEAVRDRAAGPGAHCGHRLDPLDDHPPAQRAARRSPVMTTERSEDYETTPLTGLPLFTQPVPPVAERFDRRHPMAPVAHLSTVSTHPIGSSLDWSLVSALRAQASEQLSQAVAADKGRLNKVAQEELGRTIVLDLIETTVADRVNAGMTTLPGAEQDALARAVFDSLFRLGRLQPLVDDDRIENIIITGHDNVVLELTDGSLIDGPPVADSDEELDRLPGLPRLPIRGQRSRLLRSPAAAASAPRRRLAARRCCVGDAAPLRRDPSSPADGSHARRPRRSTDADSCRSVIPAGGGAVPQVHRGVRIAGRGQDDPGSSFVRRDRPAGGDRHLRDRVRAAPARAARPAPHRPPVGGPSGLR